ncbi:MAG TPA: class I SAM-dependent DNA methyltransferase [Candidatus Rifleibacterium sp.]|nr:class I SAM-dependent DNA methyltransferase [Candidatus Rifleibacterium sp.]
MPLSWNEIKSRAIAFSKEWETEKSEDAEAKSFWDGFFNVFGITRKRVASFEEPVKKLGVKQGFIDLFWKGILLVEHKSRGKNLDRAYTQALDYFPGIVERDLPKYILVSDFARFRLYDIEEKEQHEFDLKELHKNIHLFGFVAGYQKHKTREEDPVNIKAAESMGRLHDQLKEIGYDGHQLELYLVRLLFCLFAEDTGILERTIFQDYIEERTCEDGSDLAHHLSTLFQILNTPDNKRFKNLDEQLAAFPYINGKLFEEMLPSASFDQKMRQTLLDCCALDWSRISPAIFGSLFQSIMDKTARRNLGAHYTSEKNILKLIKPLFLDALWEEFNKVKSNKSKLAEFHQRLRSLKFLDPACGCGNFLVIAYRELRLLELEVLRALHDKRQQILDVQALIKLDVDQFYGIEVEEFPAQIAQVALWLLDHQMNMQVSEEFGLYFARIPLRGGGTIVCANALQIDWQDLLIPVSTIDVTADHANIYLVNDPKQTYDTINVQTKSFKVHRGPAPAESERVSFDYIMGNPPFIGKNYRSERQDADLHRVFNTAASIEPVKLYKSLDFVAAWYYLATDYLQKNRHTRVAFVSTNSITQGEQVSILWPPLLQAGLKIHFAHRTFSWSSEARGKAAVHVVIVGFGLTEITEKTLFVYDDIKGEPHSLPARNINPYLLDAPDKVITARSIPICKVPEIVNGSKPADGGNLLLSEIEKAELMAKEPAAEQFIRPFVGADEFINSIPRFCLWLVDCSPNQLRSMPLVLSRVEAVKRMREASTDATTRKDSATPTLFQKIRQPQSNYLLIPSVSSENRKYIPIGYMTPETIVSNLVYAIPDAELYHFGVLSSEMHNSWMRAVSGRLESRYRYAANLSYNTFPWPAEQTIKHREKIENAAQKVLDARAVYPESSLADLYDPRSMPPELVKAHQNLDKAVDAAYGKTIFKTEADRVAFLFELYQQLTT